jgi:hypothetical protein
LRKKTVAEKLSETKKGDAMASNDANAAGKTKVARRSRLRLRRDLTQGAERPRGWRTAWYEPARRVAVCYPAPLHWLARGLREAAWRARLVWNAPGREAQEVEDAQRRFRERQRLADEYARGYLTGWHECFEACMDAIDDRIQALDVPLGPPA